MAEALCIIVKFEDMVKVIRYFLFFAAQAIFFVDRASLLLIELVTIGFESIKAAVANPVKSLRTAEWQCMDEWMDYTSDRRFGYDKRRFDYNRPDKPDELCQIKKLYNENHINRFIGQYK